jgi:hypothetical protein
LVPNWLDEMERGRLQFAASRRSHRAAYFLAFFVFLAADFLVLTADLLAAFFFFALGAMKITFL